MLAKLAGNWKENGSSRYTPGPGLHKTSALMNRTTTFRHTLSPVLTSGSLFVVAEKWTSRFKPEIYLLIYLRFI
jgi:hypothetical protein